MSYRGIKQMLDIDTEEEKADQRLVNALYSDPEYGGETTAGAVVGAVIEPLGILVPGGKAKSVVSMAKQGAALGFVFGGVGYVDEENGQTRIGNAATGTVVGGTVGAALGKLLTRKTHVPTGNAKKDLEVISNLEDEVARLIRSGTTEEDAVKILKKNAPELVKDAGEAITRTGKKPDFMSTARDYELVKVEREGGKPIDTISTLNRGSFFNSVDKYVGIVSTRVKNISKPWLGRFRQFEANIKMRPEKLKGKYSLFSDNFRSRTGRKMQSKSTIFTDEQELDINHMLLNGKLKEAREYIEAARGKDVAKSFDDGLKIIDELGDELLEYKIIPKKRNNYWPRIVDINKADDLFKAMEETAAKRAAAAGKKREPKTPKTIEFDMRKGWEEHIKDIEDKAAQKGKKVSEVDRAKAFQSYIMRDPGDLKTVGYAKARKIPEVPKEWVKFYNSPSYAIDNYIHRSIKDVETAKVFGKEAYAAGNSAKIEGLWNEKAAADKLYESKESHEIWKNLTNDEAMELRDLLKLRFGNAMTGTKESVKMYKGLVNIFMLTNPYSAAIQLGDLGASIYKLGIKNATKGLYTSITNKKLNKISMEEMGLEKHFAEFEDAMQNGPKFDKLQENLFRFSGFHAADRLGKESIMNGAMYKYADAVKNPSSKAYRKFVDKYAEVFDDGFEDLVLDLRKYNTNGRKVEDITDNIRTLVFNELSDVQPISLSEMPEWYLKSNAGKMFLTLKSFMLKQMDVIRNDSIHKIRHGNAKEKGEGLANLAKYVYTVGLGNMTFQEGRRYIAGKESFEDMPDDKALQILYVTFLGPMKETFKMLNMDEYWWRDVARSGLIGGTLSTFAPPTPGVRELAQGKPEDLLRYVPGVGGLSGRLQEGLEGLGIMGGEGVPGFKEGGKVEKNDIENKPTPAKDDNTHKMMKEGDRSDMPVVTEEDVKAAKEKPIMMAEGGEVQAPIPEEVKKEIKEEKKRLRSHRLSS